MTDDTINTVTHLILRHLKNAKPYARLLFVDFSPALNTLRRHLLLEKLKKMNVSPFINKWNFSFSTFCIQYVKVNYILCDPKFISTGTPQGCVCCPVLFTLHTNDFVSRYKQNLIIKFSVDSATVNMVDREHDTSDYHS